MQHWACVKYYRTHRFSKKRQTERVISRRAIVYCYDDEKIAEQVTHSEASIYGPYDGNWHPMNNAYGADGYRGDNQTRLELIALQPRQKYHMHPQTGEQYRIDHVEYHSHL